jgi:hypothetical protein
MAAAGKTRKSRGDRVRAMKVVKQPPIQAVGAKRPLDGGHIEGHVVSIPDTDASLLAILDSGVSLHQQKMPAL